MVGVELLTHVHTGALEEEGGLIGDEVSCKVLRGVDQAGDGRSAEIHSLEQVQEGWIATEMSFDLDGPFHHGECIVDFLLGVVSQTSDGSHRLFLAAATNEPPRRLRCEEEDHHEWDREDPLEGGGKSPTPLIVTLVIRIGDSGDDDTTDGPAHLQSRCTRTPETERNDLTGVGGRVGNEESPGNTFQCLSDDEHFEGVSL